MSVALVTIALALLGASHAAAQDARMEDLRQAPAARQVTSVGYCGGRYAIGFRDGSSREFGERDLRFGTDSGPMGPLPGKPVLVAAGRVGDRAIVLFSTLSELPIAIRSTC